MEEKIEVEAEGDFVITLSSALICDVMEGYFNNSMFMIPVRVEDVQPAAEGGQAFTVSFVTEFEEEEDVRYTPGDVLVSLIDKMTEEDDATSISGTIKKFRKQKGELSSYQRVVKEIHKNRPPLTEDGVTQPKRDSKGRFVRGE